APSRRRPRSARAPGPGATSAARDRRRRRAGRRRWRAACRRRSRRARCRSAPRWRGWGSRRSRRSRPRPTFRRRTCAGWRRGRVPAPWRLCIGRRRGPCRPSPAWARAVAIDRLGAVSNPIITIYREREMSFVCRQAGARVLVVPGVVRGVDHRELARAVRAAAPDLEHVLTVRAEPGPGMRALEALEAAPPSRPTPHGPHDVSMLFYTSGTTADPKGVLHTPSTLGAVIRFQAELLHPSPDDRSLLQFPLPHLGGIVMFVMLPIAHGSSTVFMESFDPELAVDLI